MSNNDPIITPNNPQPLPSITSLRPELQTPSEPKKTNKFLSVLGGVASTALNFVLPGVGGLIGSAIGGNSGGSYGALVDQQRQFEEMQRYNQAATSIQQQQQNQMMNEQRKNSMDLLGMQQRVSLQAQEFSTVSNLLKSRHDSEMSAIHNIKS